MTASTLQLPHTGRLWPLLAALGGGLVLFAYGPAYMPLLWAAALYLGRSSDAARHSVLGLLVVTAALGAIPLLLEGDVVAAAAALLLQAAGGVAVHFALDLSENRKPRGLLLAAAAWLVLPSLPGLLGLGLLALYLGHARQLGDRQRATGYHLRRGALIAALGLCAAALLPALLLNSAQTPRLVVDPVAARERQARADLPLAQQRPVRRRERAVRPFRYPFSREQWRLDRDPRSPVTRLLDRRYLGLREWSTRAAPYGIALTVALLALFMWRLRASGRSLRVRRQLHWSEPLVPLAFGVLVVSLLTVGLVLGMDNSSGPMGGGGASVGAEEVDTSRDGPRSPTVVTDTATQALTAALLPVGLGGIALALALLALALLRFGRAAEPEPTDTAPAPALPVGPPGLSRPTPGSPPTSRRSPQLTRGCATGNCPTSARPRTPRRTPGGWSGTSAT